VTRAALRGMSDSVGVFIPILKDTAEKIKEELDAKKRAHSIQQHGSIDDGSSNVGMESLIEGEDDEEEEEQEDTEDQEEVESDTITRENTPVQETRIATASPEAMSSSSPAPAPTSRGRSNSSNIKVTPSTSVSTVSTSKYEGASLQIPKRQQKPSAIAAKSIQKARSGNEVKLKQPSTTTSTVPRPHGEEKHDNKLAWLTTVKEYIPSVSLTTMASLLMLGFTIYMTMMWFRSGSKVIDEADRYLRMNVTTESSDRPSHMMHGGKLHLNKGSPSRSVYLRDLDEGFLRNSILPPYAKSQRYEKYRIPSPSFTNFFFLW
jgi:hypothetical protein